MLILIKRMRNFAPSRCRNRLHSRANQRKCRPPRNGTTLVELAFILPVFFAFMFALFEFGHALMVSNMVVSIAKQAAHQGSFEDASTADVQAFATERLNAIVPPGSATTLIKDASTFELSTTDTSSVNVASLPNIELNNTESRDLFLVHIEVPYEDVALIPPFWIRNIVLRGDSVMRRE